MHECLALNNETRKTRSTLIDLNSVGLNYCIFMISLDKSSENCDVTDDLSTKQCFPSKTTDVNYLIKYLI